MAWYIPVIFAAFGGFLLAFYIRHKKGTHEKMICPLHSDCEVVIWSEYSRFFGIPVEILGLFYYGAIAVFYGALLLFPALASSFVTFIVVALTTAAFLFSLYLTFIQAFALKQWCTWCLMSAGLCTIIFGSVIAGAELGLVSLLLQHRSLVITVHSFAAALGLGAATVADVFFFKFLKDLKISEGEADILRTISDVIWFALATLIVSGIGLYVADAETLNQNPKFLVKTLVVLILVVNGAFLNLIISPRLVKISFGREHAHEAGELRRFRRLAFALGAISITSWYSAFLLGILRHTELGFSALFLIYLFVVGSAVSASQWMERNYAKRAAES